MDKTERNVILIIVALIIWVGVALAWRQSYIRENFEQECGRLGGKTIWDGRQYQCLK